MKQLLVALVSLALLVLLAEGALSLFADRSLRELGGRETSYLDGLLEQELENESTAGAADGETRGLYRGHPDPYIGYVFHPNAELTLGGVPFRTDGLGLRRRTGPAPPADAFRIVVLGDSVAFGKGLPEDRVLAERLESLLADVRAPDARPIACGTVAVPSWNYRNAARFLLDHLDAITPDLVLYMPVPNDVDDSFGADELGRRRLLYDLGARDPLVPFFGGNVPFFVQTAIRRREAGEKIDRERSGPASNEAGLTVSSRWRIDDMARTIEELHAELGARGVELVLLPHEQHALHRQLMRTFDERGFAIRSIPLLETMQREDGQPNDPHPSIATTEAFATWTAAALLDAGLVPGAAVREFPAVDARYRDRRGVERTGDALAAWCDAYRRSVIDELEPVLDAATLRGMRQVYGGLNSDGTFGPGLLAVLPAGETLEVALAPVARRPDLVPQEVTVSIDDVEVGTVTLTSAEESAVTARFPLPAAARSGPYEVKLTPARWGVVPIRDRPTVVAARLVALRSLR